MNGRVLDRRAHPPGATFSDWAAPDGWGLRRLDWRQAETGGAPARGSLLWVGGRGDFIEKYLEPMAHWHGGGWDVASFDWRGQGKSQREPDGGHLDSFDPLVDDLNALVAEWRAAGPAPHVVVGHSMGGHLALRLAAERSVPLDALVLVAPMFAINTGAVPAVFGQGLARTMTGLGLGRTRAWREDVQRAMAGDDRNRFLTHCPERYADELWWHAREPGFDLGPPTWGWLDAAFGSIDRLDAAPLEAMAVPTLILGAERDRLVSAAAIRSVAARLSDARLLMFASSAHEILREEDAVREEALAAIDAFLAETAGR